MLIRRIARFLLLGSIIFAVLLGVRLLQGHSTRDALIHGGIWGAVSSLIMVLSGIYYARRNIDCPVCNVTLPSEQRPPVK